MNDPGVTQKELYECMKQLEEGIGQRFDKFEARISIVMDRNGTRITTLEYWRANIAGKMAVVVGISAIIISFVVDWIKDKIFKG